MNTLQRTAVFAEWLDALGDRKGKGSREGAAGEERMNMSKANPLGIAPFDAAEYLDDEESIAEFLNASVEMNDPAVLLNAVSAVARARSMSQLAHDSGLGRESLYKALKPGAQPRYETVMKVLGALGVEMVFRAPQKKPPGKKTGAGTRGGTQAEVRASANGEPRERPRRPGGRATPSRNG